MITKDDLLLENWDFDARNATQIIEAEIKQSKDGHTLEERRKHFFNIGRIDVVRKIEKILYYDYGIGYLEENNNSRG